MKIWHVLIMHLPMAATSNMKVESKIAVNVKLSSHKKKYQMIFGSWTIVMYTSTDWFRNFNSHNTGVPNLHYSALQPFTK